MHWLRRTLVFVPALLVLALVSGWLVLRASLPQLEGAAAVSGISAAVDIERDSLGTVTVRGRNRLDVAFALGYVHGQERFFEMDLLRRRAAGELSELIGAATLAVDRSARLHRFRHRAEGFLQALPMTQRQQLQAYGAGVNAGMEALAARPFPYLLLGQAPKPWTEEDSLLAPLAMYFDLQNSMNTRELKLTQMRAALPTATFAFLTAAGTEWDAPLQGAALPDPPFPAMQELDLRNTEIAAPPVDAPPSSEGIGSNNFAAAGSLSPHGGAILANDMHLGLRVPNIWFRVELRYPDAQGEQRVITGLSLPGTPFVVVGSNRHVAWGFTNSYGDWLDFFELKLDPQDPSRYAGVDGWESLQTVVETIHVRGAADEQLTVRESSLGPIVAESPDGKPLALSWTAHHAEAVNASLADMEGAQTLEQALEVAHRAGIPAQNALIASSDGRIAWTIMGRIPKRGAGANPQFPLDPSVPGNRWQGWYDSAEIPAVVSPDSGRLWTANARVVDGDPMAMIGDGGYTIGARARQIRDDLMARRTLSEADLLKIQLDDQAVFLTRWQELLIKTLEPTGEPRLIALREALADWNGRASADSKAYRLVRDFRLRVHRRFLQLFEAPLLAKYPGWTWPSLPQIEGVVWKTVQERPPHLLPKNFASWDDWLLAAAGDTLDRLDASKTPLDQATWGQLNTTAIRHPLSSALPLIGNLLDMPAQPLDGDQYMPRVQGPRFGASERMVVAPGHEYRGYLHMPGGQSGHPLSPYYGAGHADWAAGKPTPFLPGTAEHTLTLVPRADRAP
ncbi:MAG: penicillin acylase family protein [Lysobacterales bacterium]